MSEGHKHGHFSGAGAHPHQTQAFTAPKTRRFKRGRHREVPRLAGALALGWAFAFFFSVLSFIRGIHPNQTPAIDWHYVTDGLVGTALLVTLSFLWEAWAREEEHPELLPKREFDRRYPPSSASPPATHVTPVTELREYHRRIPYVEEITPTGTDKVAQWNFDHPDPMFQRPGDDRCG